MALLKLIFLFFFLVFLLKKRWLLGHALFLSAILCGLIQNLSILQICFSFITAITYKQNLLLACVIISILIFAHSLEKTGYIRHIIDVFQGVFPWPRLNLMILPALIGLLPMPGGAIFSAPFIEEIAKHYKIPRTQQAIINYWFRHSWEYSWPLYPGLLLTVHLGQVGLFELAIIDLPIMILSFLFGYIFFLSPVKGKSFTLKGQFWIFLKEIAPILTVIFLAGGSELIFYFLPRELFIILAVWVGIIWVWIRKKITLFQLYTILKDKTLLKVLYAVMAIFSFKQILIDSQIVLYANKTLINYHIPIAFIAFFLPFLVGLTIGLTLAFVGSTFPFIFSLLETTHTPLLPYAMLAYSSGIIGVLLSPMHLCLVLSIEYFHVEFSKIHQQLYWPCILMLFCIIIWFVFLKWLY